MTTYDHHAETCCDLHGLEHAEHVVIAARPLTLHPDDGHLAVVLCRRLNGESWTTWEYNAATGVFHRGHYGLSTGRAWEDFLTRGPAPTPSED